MPSWLEPDTTLRVLENQVYFWLFCQNIKKHKTRKMRQEWGVQGGQDKGGGGAEMGPALWKGQHWDGTRWAVTLRAAR